jgi:hypothetical protein
MPITEWIFLKAQSPYENRNSRSGTQPSVLGDNPDDAGVDISSIMGNSSKIWQAIK